MDSGLLGDLSDALEGLDPLEFLLQDKDLLSVAEEIFDFECETTEFQADQDLFHGVHPPSSSSSSSPSIESVDSTSFSCKICHKDAPGYKFFGVVACNGCKAFFMRALKNNTFLSFECDSGDCFKDGKWMSCKKCRFRRCKEAGMRPANGSERPVVRKKHLESHTRLQMSAYKKLLRTSSRELTREERLTIEGCMSAVLAMGLRNFVSMVERDVDVFRAHVQLSFGGKAMPLKMQKQMHDFYCFAAADGYLSNQVFPHSLSLKDRARLAKGNMLSALELADAYRLNKKNCQMKVEIETFANVMMVSCDEELSSAIKDIYSEVTDNGRIAPVKLTYESACVQDGLGLTTPKLIDRHRRATTKLSQLGVGPAKGHDPIYLYLLFCAIVYSPDFLDLDDPQEAERVQMIYVRLLQRYLRSKKNLGGDKVFLESMLAISYARELRDIKMHAFRRLK